MLATRGSSNVSHVSGLYHCLLHPLPLIFALDSPFDAAESTVYQKERP